MDIHKLTLISATDSVRKLTTQVTALLNNAPKNPAKDPTTTEHSKTTTAALSIFLNRFISLNWDIENDECKLKYRFN